MGGQQKAPVQPAPASKFRKPRTNSIDNGNALADLIKIRCLDQEQHGKVNEGNEFDERRGKR